MAVYIGLVLFASMAGAAIVIDLVFTATGIIPRHSSDIRETLTKVSIDYTFWLNLISGVLGLALLILHRRNRQNDAGGECGHCD